MHPLVHNASPPLVASSHGEAGILHVHTACSIGSASEGAHAGWRLAQRAGTDDRMMLASSNVQQGAAEPAMAFCSR